MTSQRRIALSALTAALLLGTASPGRAADDPAEWAPADAMIYAGVANCDRLCEDFKKLASWRMFHDPAAEKSVQPYERIFEKLKALAASKLGLASPKELDVRPHGAIAFWLNARPDAEHESVPQFVLVADMGRDLEPTQRLLSAVVDKCIAGGARRETSESAGAQVTVVKFPDKSASDAPAEPTTSAGGKALADEIIEIITAEKLGNEEIIAEMVREAINEFEPPEQFAYAFAGSRLVLANDLPAAGGGLRILRDGRDQSLAGGPAVRLLRGKCDADAPIHFIMNVPEFVALGMREDPEDFGKFASAANLKAFGPGVLTIAFAPSTELDSRVRGYLEIRDMQTGIGRILKLANTSTQPPPTVSATTAAYASLNLDAGVIMDEIIKITGRMDPDDGQELQAAMKAPLPDGSTLDIQNDVLAHLSGPLFGRLTLESPYSPDDMNVLIGIGHKSRPAIDRLIGLIPPGTLNPREMMGATVYDPGALPIPIVGLQMAVTDRTLIPIGTQRAVEAHIRAETASEGGLATESGFRELARHVPDRTCGMFFQNNLISYDAGLAAHKAGPYPDEPPIFGSTVGKLLQWQLGKNFIAADLDSPEALRKYQTLNLATLTSESDGLRLDVVSILPRLAD